MIDQKVQNKERSVEVEWRHRSRDHRKTPRPASCVYALGHVTTTDQSCMKTAASFHQRKSETDIAELIAFLLKPVFKEIQQITGP